MWFIVKHKKTKALVSKCFSLNFVRLIGLEPTHLAIPDPKSGASTNFATGAYEVQSYTLFFNHQISLAKYCRRARDNGQPTPNRAQSSLLELPRCEGGKDHEVGLTDNGQQTMDNG